MNKQLKNFFIAISIFIAYIFSSELAIIPLLVMGIDLTKMPVIATMLYNILYELGFIYIIYLIYQNEIKENLKDFFKDIKGYLKKYIKYWFILLILMYISNFIIFLFHNNIAKNEEAVRSLINSYPIYTFILSVILAPIMEELIFRKTFKKLFTSDILYIIMSGLAFGTMHVISDFSSLMDLLYIIPYSIPGFIFAYIFIKSKNIFVPISIHFIHNGVFTTIQILMALLKNII